MISNSLPLLNYPFHNRTQYISLQIIVHSLKVFFSIYVSEKLSQVNLLFYQEAEFGHMSVVMVVPLLLLPLSLLLLEIHRACPPPDYAEWSRFHGDLPSPS